MGPFFHNFLKIAFESAWNYQKGSFDLFYHERCITRDYCIVTSGRVRIFFKISPGWVGSIFFWKFSWSGRASTWLLFRQVENFLVFRSKIFDPTRPGCQVNIFDPENLDPCDIYKFSEYLENSNKMIDL
jgi:hypothetical protein